jgi:hypothetical protein
MAQVRSCFLARDGSRYTGLLRLDSGIPGNVRSIATAVHGSEGMTRKLERLLDRGATENLETGSELADYTGPFTFTTRTA